MKIDHPQSDAIARLGELIKDVQVAMLTTIAPDGELTSRPLQTLQVAFDGDLWFITSASSGKVVDLASNAHVNLAYARPGDNTYVSVSGRAQLLRDRARLDALWDDHMKAYFPRGKEDPDVVLLKVEVDSAVYWEGPGAFTATLLEIASRMGAGAGPAAHGEHARIDLPHQPH